MDNNTTQEQNSTPKRNNTKNKIKLIFIIAAIAIAVIAASAIIIYNAIPPKHIVNSNEDVVSYLDNKYAPDSFEVISNESNNWTVKSKTTDITFTASEKYQKNNNCFIFCKGEYVVEDDYIITGAAIVADDFDSEYFEAKREDDAISLYVGDKLLEYANITSDMHKDLVLLCIKMFNGQPLVSLGNDIPNNTIIHMNYHGLKNKTDSFNCRISSRSLTDLKE